MVNPGLRYQFRDCRLPVTSTKGTSGIRSSLLCTDTVSLGQCPTITVADPPGYPYQTQCQVHLLILLVLEA